MLIPEPRSRFASFFMETGFKNLSNEALQVVILAHEGRKMPTVPLMPGRENGPMNWREIHNRSIYDTFISNRILVG